MKRLVAFFLALMLLCSFCACTEYKPVKSTEEEARVILTLTVGGEEYEVRYELYRALFLNNKSEVDGGDAGVWSGDRRGEYIEKINKLIIDDAANIFAAIHICETEVDYNLYSAKADRRVEDFVEASVEGGTDAKGFGTYDAYLAYLKSQNLNYSVQDLLYRYYIALEEIDEYFIGDPDADSITDDDIAVPTLESPVEAVRAFYYSESCKRVLYAYFSELADKNPSFSINEFHRDMQSAAQRGRADVEAVIARSAAQDIRTGIFLSKNAYNEDYLKVITDVAFTLGDEEVSEVITVDGTADSTLDGYYVLYGIEKSEDDFRQYYTQIRLAYMNEQLGLKLGAAKNALAASVTYSEAYATLNHATISM